MILEFGKRVDQARNQDCFCGAPQTVKLVIGGIINNQISIIGAPKNIWGTSYVEGTGYSLGGSLI